MLGFAVEAGNLLEFFGFLIGFDHGLEHACNLLGANFVRFAALGQFNHLTEGYGALHGLTIADQVIGQSLFG